MKTLKITLLAAIFCTTLTGLNIKSDINSEPVQEHVTEQEDFNFAFTNKRHVKRKGEVPSNG
ncbi:hypothetical protein [Hanstruepera flava]|uniref:hypothetical protein n=1 Tax=Hanstruepera flava TaxID=2930218 RepID=UPI00202880EE|nr:hypothetical protein [Hanstruepera flava]